MSQIRDVPGLEAVVGSRPLAMMMKSIDRLARPRTKVGDTSVAATAALNRDYDKNLY